MINLYLVSPAPTLPPQSLMDNTYSALKKRVREALLSEWLGLLPKPGYYHHLPTLNPRPFMGLGKFTAGRMHDMRAGKSDLATHPTWRSPDADTSSPRCGPELETFEHAILTCPSRQGACSFLLQGVTSIGQDAPLWASILLLKRFATFIGATSTVFPPTMFPPYTPPSSPPLPHLPRAVPPAAFRVFLLAKV